jgi:tetratricopeptide (TPR) repeat protein
VPQPSFFKAAGFEFRLLGFLAGAYYSRMSSNLTMIVSAVAFSLSALCCLANVAAQAESKPQQSEQKPRIKAHDSVTVTANFTPEEVEEGKLNDIYQPIYDLERKGDCDVAIQRYESEVLLAAEKSKFNVPRNKFLFLANRGIGNCLFQQQHFQEAEQRFQKIMEYLPVWPGLDDSDYPINLRQIATAQMGQQHWEAAEESLKKSLSVADPQIDKALKSDFEFTRTEHAGFLQGSQARSTAYLAIVYVREGRMTDALATADLAYARATQPHVPKEFLKEVVKLGLLIAQASNDENAIRAWSTRTPNGHTPP